MSASHKFSQNLSLSLRQASTRCNTKRNTVISNTRHIITALPAPFYPVTLEQMLNILMTLTSCGWVCRRGMWRPAVPTWRVEPSCQLCRTQRSSGRLASATLCTDSNSALPSRRWSPSPARQHHSPPERYSKHTATWSRTQPFLHACKHTHTDK